MDGQENIVTYEFQGKLLPLEKAFAQVGKLFKRYIREAKAASEDGKLKPDEQFAQKELKNYLKQLKVFRDKVKEGGTLSEDEVAQTQRIFKKLLVLTKRFKESRDKILHQKQRETRKEEKKEQEVKDYSSISSQFKAQTQVDQLTALMSNLPRLDPKVIADINSYVEAWRQAKTALDNGEGSTEALAKATEELDKKAREYIPTLKNMIHNQKTATDTLSSMLSRVITTITSFEFWGRKIKEGIVLLGDYVESINFLDVSLNNVKWSTFIDSVNDATEAISKFKDALEEARWSLGLSATDTNTAAATFTAYANAANIASKDVLKFSQNMTQMSIDMASLYNKDTIVMMTALRSALAGNTRAMMNYGISVHDATLNEWLLEKGINRQMSKMSESSQVLVRYAYLMEKTSAAQGDLARTLKSPANQLRVLKNQITLLTQNLGALFNLIIYPMIRVLNEVLVPLNAFVSALTALSSANYSTAVKSTTDSVDDLTNSLEEASDASVGLTGLDEINQATSAQAGTKTGIDSAIQALIDGVDVYDNFMGKTSKLTELMLSLGNALAPVWAMLTDSSILDAVAWGLNAIGFALTPIKMLLDGIKSGFANAPDWLKGILNVFVSIGGVLAGLFTTIVMVSAAMAVFKTIAGTGVWKNFVTTLSMMWKGFLALGQALYAAIAKMVAWIASVIKARIEAIKTSIAQNGLAKSLALVALNALKAVWSLLSYIGKLVIMAAKAIFAAIKNLILSKSLWGVALGAIAAAGISALAVAGIIGAAVAIGKTTQSSNEPTPSSIGLATGGVVTKPTFAMIGEGKYNEAVVPLGNSPQFESMKESIAERVIEKQGVSNTNVNDLPGKPIILSIDGRTLGRAQMNTMSKIRRQVGVDIK